jgi:hypothetical protein
MLLGRIAMARAATWAALVCAACGSDVVEFLDARGGEAAGGSGAGDTGDLGFDPTASGGGGHGASTAAGGDGFCDGTQSIYLPTEDDCTGDVAKKTFLFGICACEDFNMVGILKVAPFQPSPLKSGSIGVNADFDLTAGSKAIVVGSVWAGGQTFKENAVSLYHGDIAGSLYCGGGFEGTATHVGGDLYLEGDAEASSVTVDGTLHAPPGADTAGVAAGTIVHEPVKVTDDPCNCNDPLDIAGIVAWFAEPSHNDNAAHGIDPAALNGVADATVSLPCGRFYFDAIRGGSVKIHVEQRAAIFVGGDLAVDAFALTLAPQAEADVFVAGNWQPDKPLAGQGVGDPARPAATRFYVGGFVDIGVTELSGNIYAPYGEIETLMDVTVKGSLYGRRFNPAGNLTVLYDDKVLEPPGCDDPGEGCDDCHDCANPTPACKSGHCVPCQTDADCCPPLVCMEGECVALLK